MLVVIIVVGGLIADREFIIGSTARAGPVPDSWVDADIKEIIEGRKREALTGAGADRAGIDGNDYTNAIGANELMGLMMGDMEGGIMPEKNTMRVFLSL